jgi:hypothetical protein
MLDIRINRTNSAEGIDIISNEKFALKFENAGANPALLEYEVNVYKSLSSTVRILLVHWYGFERGYRVMVLDSSDRV